MNSRPLFSVLIANYNNGCYLQQAIDSVMAQTYDNWEIILVDDGSTDNSAEIYKKYESDPRFHIYFNDKNHGCGYTKRRCAELANGEICGFLDPDDCLSEKAAETMAEAHFRHPECSLIYSQYYLTDANLTIKKVSTHQHQLPDNKTFLDEPFSGAVSHFATFKKNLYSKTEGISAQMTSAVDIDLYLKLEEVGSLLFIPTPLYYYRIGTGNNISLGNRTSSATMSDFIARIHAYQRRGENPNLLSVSYSAILDQKYKDGYSDGQAYVRKSLPYRIGFFLIRPIKKIYQFFVHE